MGVGEYDGPDTEGILYRLACCIGLPWQAFLETPAWMIRERSFHVGESIVLSRLSLVEDVHHAITMGRVESPSDYLRELYELRITSVQPTREPTQQEMEAKITELNRKAFNQLRRE